MNGPPPETPPQKPKRGSEGVAHDLSERDFEQTSGLEDRSFRFHKHAITWLGLVAIAAIAGVVVMTLCGHGTTASSLVAVATAAVAGMAAVFK